MLSPYAGPEQPACIKAKDDIEDQQFPTSNSDGSKTFFYPRDRLQRVLDRNTVIKILKCPCSRCSREAALFKNSNNALEYLEQIVGSGTGECCRTPDRSAISLFALLICSDHPALIRGFMARQCYDVTLENSPELLSEHELRRTYCVEFRDWAENTAKGPMRSNAFQRFVRKFEQNLFAFAAPRLENGAWAVYESGRILPYVEQEEIGIRNPETGSVKPEGANGRVFGFEIYEEYRKFKEFPNVRRFARKELPANKDAEAGAILEKQNLEYVRQLEDPHIIKLIKAYKIGQTIYLVFERARTNLGHLLRNPELKQWRSSDGPIPTHPAWEQLRGITKALQNISGSFRPKIDRLSPFEPFRGYHLDLKPANILVDDKSNWLISDFGQAVFQSFDSGSSRVVGRGGTDAYAPPEIDAVKPEYNHKYDVWSLGCIILEVLTFVVYGHVGLTGSNTFKGLDQVRRTRSDWRHSTDERFFDQENMGSQYRVKPEIVEFMDNLQDYCHSSYDPVAVEFLDNILILVRQMLDPVAESRLDINTVDEKLWDAYANATSEDVKGKKLIIKAVEGERVVPGPALSRLVVYLLYEPEKEWKRVQVQVFLRGTQKVRLVSLVEQTTSVQQTLVRQHTKLVPKYAFSGASPKPDPMHIFLTSFNTSEDDPHDSLVFRFQKALSSAPKLQQALTSQSIDSTFTVKSIRLKKYKALYDRAAEWVKDVLWRGRVQEDEEHLGAGTVQLWTELPTQHEIDKTKSEPMDQDTTHPRPVRKEWHLRAGFREPSLRRLVLYLETTRRIITIRLDRNWRERKERSVYGDAIVFEPKDPDRDPHFVAHELYPSNPCHSDSFAGVPLAPDVLRVEENQSRFEIDRLELTFMDSEDCKEFSRMYHRLKNSWHHELKEIEKAQGYVPTPGPALYGPIKKAKKNENLKSLHHSPTPKDELRGGLLAHHRGGGRGRGGKSFTGIPQDISPLETPVQKFLSGKERTANHHT